ncbi:hypothetical protein [Dokdonia sp.]|uniref:hypothetical protein n=1 Tax=Dokdonia sp. TaxID=2024995 RepID=UPI003264FB92
MNKFIILLLSILFLTSCSENRSYESYEDKAIESETPIPTMVSTEEAYTHLISEKLQDYFEKQKITKNHPDFKSKLDTGIILSPNQDSISSILILEKINTKEFDSLALKTVISYYNSVKKDTIISKIERTKVIIEGEEVISSKVTFKNYQD